MWQGERPVTKFPSPTPYNPVHFGGHFIRLFGFVFLGQVLGFFVFFGCIPMDGISQSTEVGDADERLLQVF